jgi:transporter family-2 protein
MAALFWALLAVAAGAAIAVQAPINAELARQLGMPIAAAAVSFFVGAIVLGAVTAGAIKLQSVSPDWRAPPLWLFVAGGCLGTIYVVSAILLTPRIGAASLMALAIAGQLLAGILLDRIGFLGIAVRELSFGRMFGALLLVCGAIMVQRF